MSPSSVLKALAVFVVVVGVIGYVRTDSIVPIIINSIICMITWYLAIMLSRKESWGRRAAIIWLTCTSLLYTYMVFGPMAGHQEPKPGYWILFGSMALFSIVALVSVMREKQEVVES